MIELQLIVNQTQVVDRLRAIPNGARRAIVRSINDALMPTARKMTEFTEQKYNISTAGMVKQMKFTKATNGRLLGLITVTGEQIPVYRFRKNQAVLTMRHWALGGVTFEEVRGQLSNIGNAFLAQMSSGHKGIFARFFKGEPLPIDMPQSGRWKGVVYRRGPKRGQLVLRQKIREITGLSVPIMMGGEKRVLPETEKFMGDYIGKRMEFYINAFLESGAARISRSGAE
jgi:hypothetical protein